MNINLRKIGDFCIVDLPRESFLKENIAELKRAISDIIEDGTLNILLNMTDITRIDGSGLGALLNLQKVALYNEVHIRLYGLQPYVAELMYQTRLNRVLDICQTEDEDICEEALMDDILIA